MKEHDELQGNNFRLSPENNKISDDSAIEVVYYEEGTSISQTAKATTLFFVMKGEISATCGFAENRLIKTNYFFLIPRLASYTFFFPKHTKLYCCRMNDEIFLCRKGKSEIISGIYKKMKLVNQNADLFAIKCNSNIINILNNYFANTNIILQRVDYLKTIIRELQILICTFYSEEELVCLFQPIFKGDIIFKSIVLQNKNKLSTVEEFATVVHLNRNSFRKRFTEIFGISPSDWIVNNKAEQVINELKKNKPIENIVHNCGFSSYPNFVRFCKNFLHGTPATLRKQIKSSENFDITKILRK